MINKHMILPPSGEIFSAGIIEQPKVYVEEQQNPPEETERVIPEDVLLRVKQMQAVILDAIRLQQVRETLQYVDTSSNVN